MRLLVCVVRLSGLTFGRPLCFFLPSPENVVPMVPNLITILQNKILKCSAILQNNILTCLAIAQNKILTCLLTYIGLPNMNQGHTSCLTSQWVVGLHFRGKMQSVNHALLSFIYSKVGFLFMALNFREKHTKK
jgi:hypothetical protein